MIRFTQGNLLSSDSEALVNTVNTVGVMGKGIALMFKERYPEAFKAYARACKHEEVRTGKMFVTATGELDGPKWIINFPTKQHWRCRTRLDWIEEGLQDLVRVIRDKKIQSIALPPLGCGNGGLDWAIVRPIIERELGPLEGVEVLVYEPTSKYQNVAKNRGVEKLTPARALIAEMIRRYEVLGLDCSILEIQKLAWFLERAIIKHAFPNPLKLNFSANMYGPYAHKLTHLLNALDGSYLRCDKRLTDASPCDLIFFNPEKASYLDIYLRGKECEPFADAVIETDRLIDGFQSPLGMEVLATVGWLIDEDASNASVTGVRSALNHWKGGAAAVERKQRLFSDRMIGAAIERLTSPEAV